MSRAILKINFYPYAYQCQTCNQMFSLIPLTWTEEDGWKGNYKHIEFKCCPFCGSDKKGAAAPEGGE